MRQRSLTALGIASVHTQPVQGELRAGSSTGRGQHNRLFANPCREHYPASALLPRSTQMGRKNGERLVQRKLWLDGAASRSVRHQLCISASFATAVEALLKRVACCGVWTL